MVRVPTIAEEDAKRPNRERECLVKERTRLVNRMKGTLARLGIRNFKPTLRQAAERLAIMHTPEGTPVPPNAFAGATARHGAAGLCCQPDLGQQHASSIGIFGSQCLPTGGVSR